MSAGPGKYDDLCTHVREEANADAAVVIIVNGNKGHGFSVQTKLPGLQLADALENIAAQIRKAEPHEG